VNLADLATSEFEHFILVLIRVSGLFVFAPFFSSQIWPFQVKTMASLTLAWVVYLTVPHANGEFLGELGMFPYMVCMELMVGFTIGFSARLIFNGALMAGSFMALHIGYGITSTIDPFTDAQNNILAQIYYMFSVLIFIVIGGHHLLLRIMVYSFEIIPLGGYSLNATADPTEHVIIQMSQKMWIIAMELSGPVLVVMMFLTIGLAMLAKAVPQMNIFAVGFLAKIALGMIVLLFTLEVSIDYFEEMFFNLQADLINIVKSSRSPT